MGRKDSNKQTIAMRVDPDKMPLWVYTDCKCLNCGMLCMNVLNNAMVIYLNAKVSQPINICIFFSMVHVRILI